MTAQIAEDKYDYSLAAFEQSSSSGTTILSKQDITSLLPWDARLLMYNEARFLLHARLSYNCYNHGCRAARWSRAGSPCEMGSSH